MTPLIDALAARRSVITYEQRGSGRSGPPPAEWTMAALADDVIALLDALAVRAVHLLCHSTGCGIGTILAAGEPRRVASLVLASPWSHADTHLATMQTLRKSAAQALDPEQYARFNAALLFPPRYRRDHEDGFTRAARGAASRPQDAGDIARRLDAILAFDARPLWPRITCPTLVVTADDDQLMPAWFAEAAAALIPGADRLRLGDGGHMITETRADAITSAIANFMRDADDAG